MKHYAPIMSLICLAFIASCGVEIDLGGSSSGGSSSGGAAEDRTSLLEGEWTLTITDPAGEYENLIEFSDTGEILHWYDQYGDDFYNDFSDGYSDVSVSATNNVSLFLQYDYLFNDILFSAEVSLSGVMFGNDNILQLNGYTRLFEDGEPVESGSLDVYALRGDDTESGGLNDGAFTGLLEGIWYFTITDFIDTEIHSIEFDTQGEMLHWVTPHGVDIPYLDPESSLYATVSSSYGVEIGAEYTFVNDGSIFSVFLEFSGEMSSQTESSMSLDGLIKVYSDGHLLSILHSSAVANRSTSSSANDNANFAFLEGEWVFVLNSNTILQSNNVICDANGDVTHWYESDGQEVLSTYSEAYAEINISSNSQAFADMYYETQDSWGNFLSWSTTSNDGIFNSANNNFMQMLGKKTLVANWGTSSEPIFISAFRASQGATSGNDRVWPIKAIASQLTNMGYGPLYSPWSRN